MTFCLSCNKDVRPAQSVDFIDNKPRSLDQCPECGCVLGMTNAPSVVASPTPVVSPGSVETISPVRQQRSAHRPLSPLPTTTLDPIEALHVRAEEVRREVARLTGLKAELRILDRMLKVAARRAPAPAPVPAPPLATAVSETN